MQNEKTAKDLYLSPIQEERLNFKLTESRFYISQEEPSLEATPDALIHCDCCVDGCVEIKHPFMGRKKFILELEVMIRFCFRKILSQS